jgi:hypothetical protein
MEKRINKTIENYISSFKDNIKNKISEINIDDNNKIIELLEYIYDYERLILSKEDLIKRKRIKNSIPTNNRCNAKRANGEQCTRRKKDDSEYCGTHVKGIPHGCCTLNLEENNVLEKKIDVIAEEVMGIVYYIDNENNVYKTEDILEGKINPLVIGKCIKNNGKITIPELNLF